MHVCSVGSAHYYVYVTLRIRNMVCSALFCSGLDGVIGKVKFRTFTTKLQLLWLSLRVSLHPNLYFGLDFDFAQPHIIIFYFIIFFFCCFVLFERQRVIWTGNFKALAINYVFEAVGVALFALIA